VHLYHAPLEVARVLFGYLYHGQVEEGPLEGPDGAYNSVELLKLSDELCVPQLFEYAQMWVANQQDLDDCTDTLAIAARHGAQLLERATLALMAANLDAPEVDRQIPGLSPERRAQLQELVQRPRQQAGITGR